MAKSRWVTGLCALALALFPATPDAVLAQTGAITGTVTLEPPPPPRRSANRYAGGASRAQTVQRIPAVVYVAGRVAGAPGPPTSVRMAQRDTTFSPAAVFVGVGGAVDFPNEDPFFHNVFSYSTAQRFDLGRYGAGESKSVDFSEPGLVNVFCEVHDSMRGLIVVTENPFHAEVAEDGSFRLEGLPPGDHEVVFLHPDHETTRRTVTVTAGGTASVEVELRR